MACGVLPQVDKQICAFERWAIGHLASITDPEHSRLIKRFVAWDVQPRLRARAECGPLTVRSRRGLRNQVDQATKFLGWLADRDLTLAGCGQAELDAWHVEHNAHAHASIRGFLLWCIANKLTRPIRLPTVVIAAATPMPQQQRIDLLGRLLTDPEPPLRSRVAAAIVLLYAQPVARIVRLTVDDVIHDDDQVLLNLGEPPSPVPGPVAELLLAWIDQRTNMNTATNRDSCWSRPGSAGSARCTSMSSNFRRRLSPKRSATTTTRPPARPRRSLRPGPATPRGPVHGNRQDGHQLATVDHADPPIFWHQIARSTGSVVNSGHRPREDFIEWPRGRPSRPLFGEPFPMEQPVSQRFR